MEKFVYVYARMISVLAVSFVFLMAAGVVSAQENSGANDGSLSCSKIKNDLENQLVLRKHLEHVFERCRVQMLSRKKRQRYEDRITAANLVIDKSLQGMGALTDSEDTN